jgi:multidrug efflux pump subunit AcrA (membrane-fusion protein)
MARSEGSGEPDAPSFKPGVVFALRAGRLERVPVLTGITDGTAVEVRSDQLKPGDLVVVGTESASRGENLQPPPGMGGPFMGGPRGGGGGRH